MKDQKAAANPCDSTATLPQEISCLAIHTIPGTDKIIIAAGLWTTQELVLLSTTSTASELSIISTFSLNTSFLVRSALITTFKDNATVLFVGIGDGTLITYALQSSTEGVTLSEDSRKTATLGTKPIVMAAFTVNEDVSIFVSSDRPTVVSRTNGRMNFASVALSVSLSIVEKDGS